MKNGMISVPPKAPVSLTASIQAYFGHRGAPDRRANRRATVGVPPGPGLPLSAGFRIAAERLFEADFSAVRVFISALPQTIGAIAFTVDERIVIMPGHYSPDTIPGRQLLLHELTHVVQQRMGRVRGGPAGSRRLVTDPALEAEADAVAREPALLAAMMMPGSARHRGSERTHGSVIQPMLRRSLNVVNGTAKKVSVNLVPTIVQMRNYATRFGGKFIENHLLGDRTPEAVATLRATDDVKPVNRNTIIDASVEDIRDHVDKSIDSNQYRILPNGTAEVSMATSYYQTETIKADDFVVVGDVKHKSGDVYVKVHLNSGGTEDRIIAGVSRVK